MTKILHVMDINDIRDRAQGVQAGDVTPDEVNYARRILASHEGNISAALYIVGYCGEASDAPLIETYLFGPDQNLYGELALKALCRYQGLIDRYRPLVRELLMAKEDRWRQSRMAAIHLASDYLENFEDDAVGCRLIEIMSDPHDRYGGSARDALIDILDLRHDLEDPFAIEFDINDEDSVLILHRARQRFDCSGTTNKTGQKPN